MSRIVQTALDVDGNLIKKGVKEVKTVKIFRLDDDPFLWTDIVRKNTRNRNAAFCNKFLKDNKFDKIEPGRFHLFRVEFQGLKKNQHNQILTTN